MRASHGTLADVNVLALAATDASVRFVMDHRPPPPPSRRLGRASYLLRLQSLLAGAHPELWPGVLSSDSTTMATSPFSNDMSLLVKPAGLERNSYDGEKCVDFFETYKQCKKQEVTGLAPCIFTESAHCSVMTAIECTQHSGILFASKQMSSMVVGCASALYASACWPKSCTLKTPSFGPLWSYRSRRACSVDGRHRRAASSHSLGSLSPCSHQRSPHQTAGHYRAVHGPSCAGQHAHGSLTVAPLPCAMMRCRPC